MDNTRLLEIPGARGKVEVDGVLGLLPKVRIDGEVIKRRRGFWPIPMRNGSTAKLTSNGVIPGFQTLYLDGKPILKLGAHVSTRARTSMYAPALIIVWPLVAAVPPLVMTVTSVLAVLMFLMNIAFVKNPAIPLGLRVAMPLVNTLVVVLALVLLFGWRW